MRFVDIEVAHAAPATAAKATGANHHENHGAACATAAAEGCAAKAAATESATTAQGLDKNISIPAALAGHLIPHFNHPFLHLARIEGGLIVAAHSA